MNSQILEQAKQLSVDERLELVEALWETIADRDASLPLTAAQEAELDSRLTDHAANPEDVHSWEDVKAAAWSRIE
jgi:putative addiction module component (TIGR02574 family)